VRLRAALIALAFATAPAFAADERQAARDTEFDGLKLLDAQYGAAGVQFGYVEKDTRPSEGSYLCGAMRRDEAGAAASGVASALSNLPSGALARVNLRYVVLCGGVTENGRTIGGIPVAPLNLLMLDGTDASSLSHRTLHELFHLIEYRSGGIGDADWVAQFGGGYSNRYPGLLTKASVGSGKPGFATNYGESHPHEDRAELFAWLLLAPRDVADLISRRGDTVLRRKVDFISDKCARVLGLSVGLPR
jgi:hypothetical protein